jgi:hypothetical protein
MIYAPNRYHNLDSNERESAGAEVLVLASTKTRIHILQFHKGRLNCRE